MWISFGTRDRCPWKCEEHLPTLPPSHVNFSCAECGRQWQQMKANWWQERFLKKYSGPLGCVNLCEVTGQGWEGKGAWVARKYLAEMQNGELVLLSSVSTILEDGLGAGEALAAWGVKEVVIDVLAQVVHSLVSSETDGRPNQHVALLDAMRRDHLWDSTKNKEKSAPQVNLATLALGVARQHDISHKELAIGLAELGQMLEAARTARFRTRDIAAELGTRAHELIDLWVKGGGSFVHYREGEEYTIDLSQERLEVQYAFAAFMEFWNSQELEFHASELTVCEVKIGVGGTLDALARDKNGKLVLLDWKTSNAVRDKNLLQVVAYARMCEVMTDELPDRAYIVRMDKITAAVQVVPVYETLAEYSELWKAWIRIIKTCRWLKDAGKKLAKFGPQEDA